MATLKTNPSEVKKIANKMKTFKANVHTNIKLLKLIRDDVCKNWQGDDANIFIKKLDNYINLLRNVRTEADKHYEYLYNGSEMFKEFEKSYDNVIGSDK